MVIRGVQYDVRVTLDKEMVRDVMLYRWRMRTDGHVVDHHQHRLSHFVWEFYNGWLPKHGIVHVNGDILDYRIENLARRRMEMLDKARKSAKIQLTPQTQEEGTVDIPSTGLPLGINNDSDSLICPPFNS
jgi:hypothetical protein